MQEEPLTDMVCHTCNAKLFLSTLHTHQGHRIQVFNITAYRVFRDVCPTGLKVAILLGKYVPVFGKTKWVA